MEIISVQYFSSELEKYMKEYVSFFQQKPIPEKNLKMKFLGDIQSKYSSFFEKIEKKLVPDEKKYPVVEMDIPEENIGHAFEQLKCCIIPRLINCWKEVFQRANLYYHEFFAEFVRSILSAFEKFQKADFANKKFILSQLYCCTRPLIDFDLRDKDFAGVFKGYTYNLKTDEYRVVPEEELDENFKQILQKTKNFISDIIKSNKMKFVISKVLQATNLNFPYDECMKILDNVKITIVEKVVFNGMVGIDGIYLSNDTLENKEPENKKICRMAGTTLHEYIHYFFRKMKNNYLMPTPKQKNTYFEIGQFITSFFIFLFLIINISRTSVRNFSLWRRRLAIL